MEEFEFSYRTPKEVREIGEMPRHILDIVIDGEVIGGAELEYFSKPLPLYQLSDVYVDFEKQGRGYGSALMEHVEKFLDERKKPGILTEAIDPDSKASGMYERRGWQKVPGAQSLYVYNWPEGVSFDILKGYPFRYTDILEREPYKNQKFAEGT